MAVLITTAMDASGYSVFSALPLILLTGVDANVAAWQYTRYGWWFRWMRWPLIRPIADHFYDLWARWRYNRLYRNTCHTDKESCDAP